jgi:hypothetical protein
MECCVKRALQPDSVSVVESSQTALIYLVSIATDLLTTDVLVAVMALATWARQEKSSAGFHLLCAV